MLPDILSIVDSLSIHYPTSMTQSDHDNSDAMSCHVMPYHASVYDCIDDVFVLTWV